MLSHLIYQYLINYNKLYRYNPVLTPISFFSLSIRIHMAEDLKITTYSSLGTTGNIENKLYTNFARIPYPLRTNPSPSIPTFFISIFVFKDNDIMVLS